MELAICLVDVTISMSLLLLCTEIIARNQMSKLTQEYQNLLHAGKCPILCRESLFDLELVEGIRVEALKLCENGVLLTAAMGSSGKEWENSYLRGDKTCWITPELCKLYDLGNMKTLIGHVMKSNKETRNIIGNSKYFTDVSVQLALYVSWFILIVFHVY